MSKPTTQVKDRYNKKTYEPIYCYLHKGQRAVLKDIADRHNISVNALILTSLKKFIAEEYGEEFTNTPAENKE